MTRRATPRLAAPKPEPSVVPMRLYLMRHAHALSEEEDAKRPLSDKGLAAAVRVAEFVAPMLEDIGGILHSPLPRSRETAVILAKALGKPRLLREVKGIEPEDDPDEFLSVLQGRSAPLVVVGHEPHLGRLVSLLLTGDANHPLVLLKKGGVVCLRGEPGGGSTWLLEWALKPKLLAGLLDD